mgnify:CR=1 FL=1|jgi:cysteine desulfurase
MPPPASSGDFVYLDHAAATRLRPEVAAAMDKAAAVAFANPSSPHAAGRLAKRLLEESRERILGLVGGRTAGAHRDRLIFTSGATEANRLAVLGLAEERPGWIATSARDHASLRQAAADLERRGWQASHIPLGTTGSLDADVVSQAFAGAGTSPCLLAVTTVCGQTGIREDLDAIAGLAAERPGTLIHADATQAAAWEALDFARGPATSLALAPHKFGGPRGIGGLVVRAAATLRPLTPGPQELGLRGGTEAVSLAVGFACGLELAVAERSTATLHVTSLRQRFEREFLAATAAAGFPATVIGKDCPRSPHVTAVAITGVDRQTLVMAADLEGVCLATGTACASGSSEPPAILAALGIDAQLRTSVVRASFSPTLTDEDMTRAIARLKSVFARLRRSALLGS